MGIDFDLIRKLRNEGVLQNMNPERMQEIISPTGIICCSDAHQRDNINSHIRKIWDKVGAERIIHEIKFAGAHVFAANSTIVDERFNENLFIRDQVSKGIKLGKIKKKLMLIGHYPCGLAGELNLNLYDALLLQLFGAEELQFHFHDIRVSNLFHVDYRNGVKRTYHLDIPTATKFVKDYVEYKHAKNILFLTKAVSN